MQKDEELIKKQCAKFKKWMDETSKILSPLVDEWNDTLFKLFTEYPDMTEFKFVMNGVTYVIEREIFMKKQLEKRIND